MLSTQKKGIFAQKPLQYLVTAAMIAAIYAALTYAGAAFAYGPVQFRISEALVTLAALTPAAIPGLTIGCVLSNLSSPWGLLDVAAGSFATLLAALFAYGTRKIRFRGLPIVSPFGAVLFNGLIVGGVIRLLSETPILYGAAALQVAAGELVVCYGLGLPLFWLLHRIAADPA